MTKIKLFDERNNYLGFAFLGKALVGSKLIRLNPPDTTMPAGYFHLREGTADCYDMVGGTVVCIDGIEREQKTETPTSTVVATFRSPGRVVAGVVVPYPPPAICVYENESYVLAPSVIDVAYDLADSPHVIAEPRKSL